MKNFSFRVILIFFILVAANVQTVLSIPASAEKSARQTGTISTSDIKENEIDLIKRFSIKNKFQRSPETQIKSFYKDYIKYSETNNIEKLKTLYSERFVNNDGFNKKTVFKMYEESADAYKDIAYSSTVDKIYTDGNYAVVDMHEFAMGTTTKKNEEVNDYGLITSDLYYTDYLVKEDNKWKIISTFVKAEKVALKYGEAKNMPVEITAPTYIPQGCEYDVKVTTDAPNGVLVIGSIVNDPIVYPHVQKKDVFKSVKSGVLERVVRANTDGNNEYVATTIGITRASIEPPNVVFSMTGMAFVLSRVNVVSENKANFIQETANVKK